MRMRQDEGTRAFRSADMSLPRLSRVEVLEAEVHKLRRDVRIAAGLCVCVSMLTVVLIVVLS